MFLLQKATIFKFLILESYFFSLASRLIQTSTPQVDLSTAELLSFTQVRGREGNSQKRSAAAWS